MANEFKQLSGVVSAPQITIVKPQSAAEALYGGSLSLFAPLNGGSTDTIIEASDTATVATSNTTDKNASTNNSSSNLNGGGGFIVKKV